MSTRIFVIRCDVCGRYISYDALDCGKAVHRMVEPSSDRSSERYESLCPVHMDEDKPKGKENY